MLFCHLYYGPSEVAKIVNSERRLRMYIFYSAEDILYATDGSCALRVQRNRKGKSVSF